MRSENDPHTFILVFNFKVVSNLKVNKTLFSIKALYSADKYNLIVTIVKKVVYIVIYFYINSEHI